MDITRLQHYFCRLPILRGNIHNMIHDYDTWFMYHVELLHNCKNTTSHAQRTSLKDCRGTLKSLIGQTLENESFYKKFKLFRLFAKSDNGQVLEWGLLSGRDCFNYNIMTADGDDRIPRLVPCYHHRSCRVLRRSYKNTILIIKIDLMHCKFQLIMRKAVRPPMSQPATFPPFNLCWTTKMTRRRWSTSSAGQQSTAVEPVGLVVLA